MYLLFDRMLNAVTNLEFSYTSTLEFKDKIYNITQPKSPAYKDIKIQTSPKYDNFATYLELLEAFDVDKRLSSLEETISKSKKFLKEKEKELRKSKDNEDKIYCLWVLDKKSVVDISYLVGYQKTAVYSTMRKIKENLRKNCGKNFCHNLAS